MAIRYIKYIQMKVASFPNSKGLGVPVSFKKTSSVASARPPAVSLSADCQGLSSWNPACLQELYEIPSTPAKPAANVFGVSGFENNFANKRDLKVYHPFPLYSIRTTPTIAHQTFLETYRPDMNPNTTFGLLSVDDGINNQLPAGAGIAGVGGRFLLLCRLS